MMEATLTKDKVATKAGVSRRKGAGNLKAEARGTPNIACRMLQLYLVGPARTWLSDLEQNSIFCWFDLKNAFKKHFRGTYKRPATTSDLQACIQKKGETSRNFLTRCIPKLSSSYAIPLHQQKKNRDNGVSNSNKRKNPPEDQKGGGSDMVAMTFQRGGQEAEEAADVEAEQAGASSALTRSPQPDPASDHPAVIPKECYALVVSPRIDGYDFSKCLMDGGASLNIMYLETLERMNLTKEQLKHSTTEFHGVVPGKKANSLGSIKLPVAFGDVNNFREEMITFEVVPFKSSYHVIFGRPTYHKFHARACYIYNKLNIPSPNGMITISGDYKKARDCEEGEATFAESVISGEELDVYGCFYSCRQCWASKSRGL
ncbi:hypothetical protein QYE76_033600 [Lolium multiflorum]|uniref:Retrotransposon gag domain-containing protein n=1 Tax=Lolium multiflorum TaxID=4521 RepID=A0AAD8QXQ3_LOLMU|nr:hypothetical protein QYE76_033600 [Lolium multiflorum]